VLGATGHIGSHIVRALLAGGHAVRAAFRSDRYLHLLDGLPVERVRVDLDTGAGLAEALAGCEWVFHAAAYYPSFRDAHAPAIAKGLETTRRALEAFRRAPLSRIVFTSSAATIQRVPDRPATEEDAESWPLTHWRPLYGTVKIAIEHEVRSAAAGGLPAVIVNPSLCLGEYDAHPFSGRAILAFAKWRMPWYIDHQFNAVYTGDVGIGHVRAAERGRIGERYLLACRNVTLKEFAELVCRAAGTRPPRWRVPYRVALAAAIGTEAAAWLLHREPLVPRQAIHSARLGQLLDGSKAVRELGMPQTPIEEAIDRALAWFRRHGQLSGTIQE